MIKAIIMAITATIIIGNSQVSDTYTAKAKYDGNFIDSYGEEMIQFETENGNLFCLYQSGNPMFTSGMTVEW